jgi:signal transduction histidine kinase
MEQSMLEHILSASRRMAETRALDTLLNEIMDEAVRLVGAECGYLVLAQPDGTLDLRVQRGQPCHESDTSQDQISRTILEQVIDSGQPLVLRDAMSDARFGAADSVVLLGLRSVMCVPLISRGDTIGAIYAENRSIRGRFKDEDIVPLALFANQIAVDVENARLLQELREAHDELEHRVQERTTALAGANARLEQEIAERVLAQKSLQQRNQELDLLNQVSQELTATLNLNLIVRQLLQVVTQTIGVQSASVWLRDDHEDALTCQALLQDGIERTPVAHHVAAGEGLMGRVVDTGESQLVAGASSRPQAADNRIAEHTGLDATSALAVPLRARDAVIGVLLIVNKLQGDLCDDDRVLVETLAASAAIAADNARLVEALREHSEQLEARVRERTRALQDAQEQLVRREKLAVLGQLAGGVGHDLRNPLGVISNALYILNMVHADADETTREYLDVIEAEVQRAEAILADLLNLARIQPPERRPVALAELIAGALSKEPPPETVDVETQVPHDLAPVLIDPQQLGRVLINLVNNAYQAMSKGGRLAIRAKQTGNSAVLSIADTGSGIAEEHMAMIFEPLFTTKSRGIGLGLSTSRNLVEANGGTIKAESQEGQGTTFTVTLPLATPSG